MLQGNRRKVNYLRLSITDRCNLNCMYCTPMERSQFLAHDEILRYEEMFRIVSIFVSLGVKSVRITGGEPLVKKNITDLVKMLNEIKGLDEVTMTTNGVYLKDMAKQLKNAGLDRVNVSLDTLNKRKYARITGIDSFEDVWSGVHKALDVGLHPVKLNTVVIKGMNDDEILDFVRLTFRYYLSIRFIEFFPTSKRSERLAGCVVTNDEIKQRIAEHFGEMIQVFGVKGNGPAEYYKLNDSKGLIGFISGSSNDFCGECNRMRVDCAGRISPCLFSGYIYDLRYMLRNGMSDDQLSMYIKDIIETKSMYKKNTVSSCKIEMSNIGG